MSRNILGLLVSVLLLIQISNAVPVPHQELRDYYVVESAKFFKDLLMKEAPLIEKITENAATIESQEGLLRYELKQLGQFLIRIKELNDTELTPNTAFTTCVFVYGMSLFELLENDSDKYQNFWAKLEMEKNWKDSYTAYSKNSLQKLSDKLIVYFDQYIADLSSEDKEKEANLISELETFKAKASTRVIDDVLNLTDLFNYDDLEKCI